MRAKSDPLADVNLLEIVPVRLAAWEEKEGRVVLERPPAPGRGLRRLLRRLSHALSASRIRLDEVGSFAWLRFDGSRTVGEVAREMRERFGERVEPAEERLGRLVRMLRREELLAYSGWDEGPHLDGRNPA